MDEKTARHNELKLLEAHMDGHGVPQDPPHWIRTYIKDRLQAIDNEFKEKAPAVPVSSGQPASQEGNLPPYTKR